MNKYITMNEYLMEKGINLDTELQDDDNLSAKTERFIKEVTDWCVDYLVDEYGCNELNDWDSLKEFRQMRFRKGVMEQIEYVLNNGWISKDSGIVKNNGTIMNFADVQLGHNAYRQFKLGAFCNIVTY